MVVTRCDLHARYGVAVQSNYCFADKAHVERSIPSGERWVAVRVVIDPAHTWETRDQAQHAIDALPDAVACAMLEGQRDEWAEDLVD